MKRIPCTAIRIPWHAAAVCLLAALALVSPARAERRGEWRLESRPGRDRVQLALHYSEGDWDSWHGHSLPLSALAGLTRAQLEASTAEVRFRLIRDAGRFELEGQVESGRGSGVWRFEPDPAFAALLAHRGYAAPSATQQFQLALEDIGAAYLDELDAQGYRHPTTAGLVRMGNHGVGLDYLRGMGAKGLKVGDPEDLVRLRDHGVDPEFVEGLEALGYRGLDARELTQLRDHGVDPNYIEGLRAQGIEGLEPEVLLRLRDHGVDPQYVAGLRKLGYRLAPGSLVELRDHGVDPRFVSELAAAGFSGLSPADLKRARDSGVDGSFARQARARHPERITIDDLIDLRNRGER